MRVGWKFPLIWGKRNKRTIILEEQDLPLLERFFETQGYWGRETAHDQFAHELAALTRIVNITNREEVKA